MMNNVNTISTPAAAPAAAPTAVAPTSTGSVNMQPQTNKQAYDNERLFVLSHPSMNLIEITVLRELNKQFPKFFALLMFVPGKPDNSKQSGRTYVMDKKEFIKFSIAELFQLAYALEEAAVAGTSDFIKFADTSKFKGGEQVVKKVTVNAVNNGGKIKVYVNYVNNTSGANIATTFSKWDAIGFANEIRAIAERVTIMQAKFKADNG